MAIRTTFELYDIIGNNTDLHIDATDKEGNTQHVITAADARRYVKRKYGERRYTMLSGGTVTTADAGASLLEDFTLWVKNRQHNIDRQYQALFDYEYSPIENVDRYENETIEKDATTTYGKVDTESGTDTTNYGKVDTLSGSDSTTYGKVDTLSGTDSLQHGKIETNSGTDTTNYGKVETHSGNDVVTDSGDETTTRNGDHTTTTTKAGFNAPNAYTPSEKVAENFDDLEDKTDFGKVETTAHGHKVTDSGSEGLVHGHVVTDSGTDSTTYGKKNTESGSDSVTYGKKNTESGSDSTTYGHKNTQSGDDVLDDDTERTLHVHGNIGVTTNNQLIEAELEMRMMSLAEMLLDNFVNDYTFYS